MYHIFFISTRISGAIGVLYRVKDYFPRKILKIVYYSFIYPYLTYGIIFWGNAAKIHVNKIILLQKKAVRIINGSNYLDHTNPIFKSCSLLKLPDIFKMETCKFIYKDIQFSNVLELP